MKALSKTAVPRESDISLEPLQISSKRRNLHVGRHGEVAQVFRKFRNIKADSPKTLF